jgi:hypothetical protein
MESLIVFKWMMSVNVLSVTSNIYWLKTITASVIIHFQFIVCETL